MHASRQDAIHMPATCSTSYHHRRPPDHAMAATMKAFAAHRCAANSVSRARSVAVRCDAIRNVWSLPASVLVAAGLLASPAYAGSVSFGEPSNGASITSPVHLSMQVQGKAVRPAAEGLDLASGHFHVLVDEDLLPEEGESIPFDDTHLHYGKGQTEVDVELTPGKHTLTLQFANANHQSYGPEYANTISVNIK